MDKARLAASFWLGARFGNGGAQNAWRSFPAHRDALRALENSEADIIHAHDWEALPAAVLAAKIIGAKVIYDAHEFAPELHTDRLLWRLAMTPAISLLERQFIKRADAVIAVSRGLADAMENLYNLENTPVLVRNIPAFVDTEHIIKPDDHILLHYHGGLTAGRGLHSMVEALALLPKHFRLRFVGPAKSAGVVESLTAVAKAKDVLDRVTFLPSVPVDQVVETAASAHIGLCILTDQSTQNRFALSNKFFEYLMAGLSPIVAGSETMMNLRKEANVGSSPSDFSAEALAQAISSVAGNLPLERKNALKAAQHYRWEKEAKRLHALYGRLART